MGQAGWHPQCAVGSAFLIVTVVRLLLHSVAFMAFVPPVGLCAVIMVGRQSLADQPVSCDVSTKRRVRMCPALALAIRMCLLAVGPMGTSAMCYD